jgi:hypothetical protein
LQAFGEHGGIYAHADTEMMGHFEEAAGHDRGFVLFAETADEGIGVAFFQTGEGRGAEFGGSHRKELTAVGGEEVGEQSAVSLDDGAGAFSDSLEILQGDHAEEFGGMGWDRAEQIVEAVHGAGLVGLGQDPAAAQAAKAVDFGKATGYDEFFAQVE